MMEKQLNLIKHQEALIFVENLPDNSVDFVFIDPPYGELELWYKMALHMEFQRVCPDGQIAVYGTPQKKRREFWVSGWIQLIPWIKPVSTKPAVWKLPEFMEHLLLYKRVRLQPDYHWSQYTGILTGKVERNTWLVEPTTHVEGELFYWRKPMEDVERIIRLYTKPGDVVLDCFAGSGTVLEACQNLGRTFIGCDINPRWIE